MGNTENSELKNTSFIQSKFTQTRFWRGQPVLSKALDGNVQNIKSRLKLRHPHLLSTLGIEGGEIIFETSPEDLNSFLKRGTFSENDMLAFLRGTVSALAYLQGMGITHGFVQPQTIFHEQSQGTFKIYDQELLTGKNYTMASAKNRQKCFVAPEIVDGLKNGRNSLDDYAIIKADVFSLGMVAIEAGTGLKSQDCFNFSNFTINYEIIDKRLSILREKFSIQIAHTIKLMIMPYLTFRPDFIELFDMLINLNPGRVGVNIQPYNPNRVIGYQNQNGMQLQSAQSAIAFLPNIYSNLPIHVANENNYLMELKPSKTEFVGNEIQMVQNQNQEFRVVNPQDKLHYQMPVQMEPIPKNAFYEDPRISLNPNSKSLYHLDHPQVNTKSFIRHENTNNPYLNLQSPKLSQSNFTLEKNHSSSPYDRIKEKIQRHQSHKITNLDSFQSNTMHARPYSTEKAKGSTLPVSYNITINNFASNQDKVHSHFYSPSNTNNFVNSQINLDKDIYKSQLPFKPTQKKSLEERLDSVLDRSQKLMDKIKIQLEKKTD